MVTTRGQARKATQQAAAPVATDASAATAAATAGKKKAKAGARVRFDEPPAFVLRPVTRADSEDAPTAANPVVGNAGPSTATATGGHAPAKSSPAKPSLRLRMNPAPAAARDGDRATAENGRQMEPMSTPLLPQGARVNVKKAEAPPALEASSPAAVAPTTTAAQVPAAQEKPKVDALAPPVAREQPPAPAPAATGGGPNHESAGAPQTEAKAPPPPVSRAEPAARPARPALTLRLSTAAAVSRRSDLRKAAVARTPSPSLSPTLPSSSSSSSPAAPPARAPQPAQATPQVAPAPNIEAPAPVRAPPTPATDVVADGPSRASRPKREAVRQRKFATQPEMQHALFDDEDDDAGPSTRRKAPAKGKSTKKTQNAAGPSSHAAPPQRSGGGGGGDDDDDDAALLLSGATKSVAAAPQFTVETVAPGGLAAKKTAPKPTPEVAKPAAAPVVTPRPAAPHAATAVKVPVTAGGQARILTKAERVAQQREQERAAREAAAARAARRIARAQAQAQKDGGDDTATTAADGAAAKKHRVEGEDAPKAAQQQANDGQPLAAAAGSSRDHQTAHTATATPAVKQPQHHHVHPHRQHEELPEPDLERRVRLALRDMRDGAVFRTHERDHAALEDSAEIDPRARVGGFAAARQVKAPWERPPVDSLLPVAAASAELARRAALRARVAEHPMELPWLDRLEHADASAATEAQFAGSRIVERMREALKELGSRRHHHDHAEETLPAATTATPAEPSAEHTVRPLQMSAARPRKQLPDADVPSLRMPAPRQPAFFDYLFAPPAEMPTVRVGVRAPPPPALGPGIEIPPPPELPEPLGTGTGAVDKSKPLPPVLRDEDIDVPPPPPQLPDGLLADPPLVASPRAPAQRRPGTAASGTSGAARRRRREAAAAAGPAQRSRFALLDEPASALPFDFGGMDIPAPVLPEELSAADYAPPAPPTLPPPLPRKGDAAAPAEWAGVPPPLPEQTEPKGARGSGKRVFFGANIVGDDDTSSDSDDSSQGDNALGFDAVGRRAATPPASAMVPQAGRGSVSARPGPLVLADDDDDDDTDTDGEKLSPGAAARTQARSARLDRL